MHDSDEEKRQLLKPIFSNMTLDEGTLDFTFSKPFQLLSQAVRSMNGSKIKNLEKIPQSIFELTKKPGIIIPNDVPCAYRPNWLAE